MSVRMVDYLMDRLAAAGAHHVFFVPGSGCLFLTDALARSEGITPVSMHHEQAVGMAALTYAKCNERLGACVVTTGCGGTNAVTALLHAWQDSVPCVFVSGQAYRNQTVHNAPVPLRQMGRQEADILRIVEPISKYAVMLDDPADIVYEIDKALHLATTGRKGPVWIDVPLDIQGAMIEPDALRRFTPEPEPVPEPSAQQVQTVLQALKQAERPVLLVGNGVRLAGATKELLEFVDQFGIPVAYARLGHDLLPTDHPLSIGMVGALGASRAGNFAVANSDLLLCVGTRLSINTTGYDYDKFARAAKTIVVDIDREEHQKNTVRIDEFILADAKAFLSAMALQKKPKDYAGWQQKCAHWKDLFSPYKRTPSPDGKVDMYTLMDALSDALPDDATVLSDAGCAVFIVPTALRVREGQRSITSGGQAEMGYSLPGAIGAAYVRPGKVVAVNGDGSIMMNLQELQTLATLKLPVVVLITNNNGYSCIRTNQTNVFRTRYIGCDPQTGIAFPDFGKIAAAFGLPFVRIESADELAPKLKQLFEQDGPVVCEVMCVEKQEFLAVGMAKNSKKRMVNRPLEDQSPFLDRETFLREMIIDPIDQ